MESTPESTVRLSRLTAEGLNWAVVQNHNQEKKNSVKCYKHPVLSLYE